nr:MULTISPECIES: phenylalanine 4-monooxygenase [unclassified Parafrankia]
MGTTPAEEVAVFEETQYFAPVVEKADGQVEVRLASSHPGAADREYQARRNQIAQLALRWRPGQPVPRVAYTEAEHALWRLVTGELALAYRGCACAEFLRGAARLGLPADRIPQLDEVSGPLSELTGFRYVPAAGLVGLREFYGSLADGVFHATQYLRHHTVPFYTPEPDVVHEVVGHANALASDRFAALYRAAGAAARRAESADTLQFISKVFWFTLEFGTVYEDGELKAYGAGILSSYGEMAEFRSVNVRPLDVTAMGTTDYDITRYQPVLYSAESFGQIEDVVGGFFAGCDDTLISGLRAAAVD